MAELTGSHGSFERTEEPKRASDRSFGFVFSVVFAIVAAWPLLDGVPISLWSLGIAIAFLVMALIRPSLLAPLNRVWTAFGRVLHSIMSPLVMALLFFVVLTPTAWLMRCFSSVPLQLHFDRTARSYWITRTPPGPAPDTMNRQF